MILFAFSSVRNNARTPASINIHFNGENPLFIGASSVDNMLIQKQEYIQCVTKDVLDLKALESTISSHEMIETAEVVSKRYKVGRDQQDEYALQSQQRTAKAQNKGYFDDEIIPVKTIQAFKNLDNDKVDNK